MDLSFLLNNLIYVYLTINVLAFLVMLNDKLKSRTNHHERISEGQLFFLATIFGALGVYLGMFIFRHKTKKWYFIIGIPLLIVQNIASIYFLYLAILSRIS